MGPVCCKCNEEMMCHRNGVIVVKYRMADPAGQDDNIVCAHSGDRYVCRNCGNRFITGLSPNDFMYDLRKCHDPSLLVFLERL